MLINGVEKTLEADVEKYIKELEAKVAEYEKKIATFEATVEQEVKVELAKVGGWVHAKASMLEKDFVGAEQFVIKLFEGLGKHMQKPAVVTPPVTPSQPPTA
jgi:hypothetical protein